MVPVYMLFTVPEALPHAIGWVYCFSSRVSLVRLLISFHPQIKGNIHRENRRKM